MLFEKFSLQTQNGEGVNPPRLLSFCKKSFDFSLFRLYPALLEGGLAAASAVEGLGHFLAQLTL